MAVSGYLSLYVNKRGLKPDSFHFAEQHEIIDYGVSLQYDYGMQNLYCARSFLGEAVVQWLKLSAWKGGDRRLESHSGL